MDFQSAMDTFVEAWMAANTKNDQVQSQALALTHKTSPPSRPSSVSSLPRSPQSHQSQQSQQQSTPQPPSSTHPHQSQTPLGTSSHQTPFSAHNQHPKQEITASPKQEGFDLSKSASSSDSYNPTRPSPERNPGIRESKSKPTIPDDKSPDTCTLNELVVWLRCWIDVQQFVGLQEHPITRSVYPSRKLFEEILSKKQQSSPVLIPLDLSAFDWSIRSSLTPLFDGQWLQSDNPQLFD
ncbi:hypothetical protein M0804_012994 [Polistes exclamans]|nr:hypothetical protein M0804_012994 [Polistes exclamans]